MDNPSCVNTAESLKEFLVCDINRLITYVKETPVDFVADFIIYFAIACPVIVLLRCISAKVSWCKKAKNFLLPRGSIQLLTNVVQTISIIIAIIFSDNVLNMINLEEKKKELEDVKKEVETKNTELDNVKIKLGVQLEELDKLTNKHRNLQITAKKIGEC